MSMKPINEVYPDEAKEEAKRAYFYGPSDYAPLLESFGFNIPLKVDDDYFQGDSRLILKDGDRYGILIFGWGSCSGCDALQACNSMLEIDQLRTELLGQIQWFESKAACLEWVNKHKWDLDHSWHADETKRFIEQAKELLDQP
jgi:hypothetical protein